MAHASLRIPFGWAVNGLYGRERATMKHDRGERIQKRCWWKRKRRLLRSQRLRKLCKKRRKAKRVRRCNL